MQRLVLLGISVVLVGSLVSCADDEGVSAGPAQPVNVHGVGDNETKVPANPTAGRTGALPDGGAASCVESYTPKALTGRAFAFDGVVVEIGASVSDLGDDGDLGLPGVTFKVRKWFSGGRTDTVTVDMQLPTAGSDSDSSPGDAYNIGSRLLVSGEARWGGAPLDAPIAWGCGFSRYYDPQTATAWRDALAR